MSKPATTRIASAPSNRDPALDTPEEGTAVGGTALCWGVVVGALVGIRSGRSSLFRVGPRSPGHRGARRRDDAIQRSALLELAADVAPDGRQRLDRVRHAETVAAGGAARDAKLEGARAGALTG